MRPGRGFPRASGQSASRNAGRAMFPAAAGGSDTRPVELQVGSSLGNRCLYPLVICYIAIENHHRNSGFSH